MVFPAIKACFLFGSFLGSSLLAQAPYLGQPLPGREAVPFAEGVLNTGHSTRDIALMPDGSEVYVGLFLPGFHKALIIESHQAEGAWTPPEVAPFSRDPRWRCLEPCISPDGRRFFFTSDRPVDPKSGKPGPFGIWMMERQVQGWSEARRLPDTINGGGNTFYPTVTRDGTLYFLKEEGQGGWILRSRWKDGAWGVAEKLPAPFNKDSKQANPRVDPDERFVLVPLLGRPDSLGGADYYAYFKRPDGSWTEPVHLGPTVNSPANDEYSINLSPDGKVVFFGSDRVIPRLDGHPLRWSEVLAERTLSGNGQTTLWWVDAGFLWDLRAKALAHPKKE
ncbi:hypothetical protein [Geothrix sp. PMB-07]|uniref:TolB family protein n=1 Tax=Geothrix sp. PMB-07 TaxID=3068640 RepID=UPI002741352A|nr:hypothetical protein [Geothrix sp. PMB-07]WLT33221.1 hypothetical protein Q9293_07775 [Geothrix sp. PMB-07]